MDVAGLSLKDTDRPVLISARDQYGTPVAASAKISAAMELTLEDKVAIITGAAGGIGAATADLFVREGARVLLVDRDAAALARLAEQIGSRDHVSVYAADVSAPDEVAAYVAAALGAWGRIDVLFNNAGIQGAVTGIVDYPPEEFDRVLAVNVRGVFLGMKHALPHLLAQGSGAIVNTASTTGVVGFSAIPAYTASKHAVIGLTRAAAAEVAPAGVRVNAIAPGITDTPIIKEVETALGAEDPDEIKAAYLRSVPSGRYGEAAEQAAVVAFLASDRARYVNGAVWLNDGGMTATREPYG